MTTTIPALHTAGDTFSGVLDGAACPASAGWTAQLVLIGPARITLSATASGADHAVTALATATGAWIPGSYQVRAVFTLGAERRSADIGALQVRPDPAAAGTDARKLLGRAEGALADLQAAYDAALSSGKAWVQEYEIAGRRMRFRDIGHLAQALDRARRDVQAERSAQRAAAGLNPRTTYITRM